MNGAPEQFQSVKDPEHIVDTYSAGDRVIAEINQDERGRPAAKLLQVLDESVPDVADFSLVCLRHDLPEPFLDDVNEAAAAIKPDWSLEEREDWRERLFSPLIRRLRRILTTRSVSNGLVKVGN